MVLRLRNSTFSQFDCARGQSGFYALGELRFHFYRELACLLFKSFVDFFVAHGSLIHGLRDKPYPFKVLI